MSTRRRFCFIPFVNRKHRLEQLGSVKRLTVGLLTGHDYSKNRDAHVFPASVRYVIRRSVRCAAVFAHAGELDRRVGTRKPLGTQLPERRASKLGRDGAVPVAIRLLEGDGALTLDGNWLPGWGHGPQQRRQAIPRGIQCVPLVDEHNRLSGKISPVEKPRQTSRLLREVDGEVF